MTINLTRVNHESNEILINDLMYAIAMIKPNGVYHIELPKELGENIAKIKQRLELYQDLIEVKNEPLEENPLIALIVLNDSSIRPIDIFSSGNILVEEICDMLFDAISKQEEFITIGGTKIEVNSVWKVIDGKTNKPTIINDENDPKIPPITSDSISKMHHNQLVETIHDLNHWMLESDDVGHQESLSELLSVGIDTLEERFLNERYEHERLDNILAGFISEYGIFKLFEMYLVEIKKQQQNPNDKYRVAEEMFGDMDEFMRGRSYLKEKF
jgi:hypothetical protein